MSSGYVIASVTVTNPTQYEEYRKWSTVAMQAHGAAGLCDDHGLAYGAALRPS